MEERVNKPTYCTRLGILMTEHKESQEKLASAIGVNRDKVNNWLGNRSKPSINDLIKIADHYAVSVDYLIREEIKYTTPDKANITAEQMGISEKSSLVLVQMASSEDGKQINQENVSFINRVLESAKPISIAGGGKSTCYSTIFRYLERYINSSNICAMINGERHSIISFDTGDPQTHEGFSSDRLFREAIMTLIREQLDMLIKEGDRNGKY